MAFTPTVNGGALAKIKGRELLGDGIQPLTTRITSHTAAPPSPGRQRTRCPNSPRFARAARARTRGAGVSVGLLVPAVGP